MSDALKERLKRCGRYHSSPGTSKRFCDGQRQTIIPRGQEVCCKMSLIDKNEGPKACPIVRVNSPSKTFGKANSYLDTNEEAGKGISKMHSPKLRTCMPTKLGRIAHLPKWCNNICGLHDANVELESCQIQNAECIENNLADKENGVAVGNDSESSDVTQATQLAINNKLASSLTALMEQHSQLQQALKDKEDCLRKLKMVKMYRTKNNLSDLQHLIVKWRLVSQQALLELHSKLPEPRPKLSHLVHHLQINTSLIHFNEEEESFD